jgi:hypothetical protein
LKVINTGHASLPSDLFLFVISDKGTVTRAQHLSLSSSSALGNAYPIRMGFSNLKRMGNYYIFGGSTSGFATT